MSRQALSTVLKDKEKIKAALGHGEMRCKKMRASTFEEVGKRQLIWFKQARSIDAPVSGLILMQKGEEIAKHLGHRLQGGWTDSGSDMGL